MSADEGRPPTKEERELWLAEARKFDAERRKAEAEAEAAECDAAKARIELDREQYKRSKELVADEHQRIYRYLTSVSEASVKSCVDTLESWSRLTPDCDFTIIFTSPGGSVIDGMALFDFLSELRGRGHKLTTVARGYAASMAGILLQSGDVRVMGAEAWLLIHEASFGAVGSFGDVVDTVEWIKAIQERILDIFAARSKLTKRQIKRRWHRKDWWLSSSEALKLGFIDEIR